MARLLLICICFLVTLFIGINGFPDPNLLEEIEQAAEKKIEKIIEKELDDVLDALEHEIVNYFEPYLDKYGIKLSTEDKGDRRDIFQRNIMKLRRLKDKLKAKLGITKFSHLTFDEFKHKYLMKKRPEVHTLVGAAGANENARLRPGADDNVPSSFDLRDVGAVTPIKDQGECGSCWTFSTAAVIESQYALHASAEKDLSEQNLVDCVMNFDGCDGGLPLSAMEFVKRQGFAEELEYPYTAEYGTCRNATGRRAFISGIDHINGENNLAEYIYKYGPVTFYFLVPESFQFYTGGTFEDSCQGATEGYHAMTIIGYTTDEWIIKNSWGTDFGEQGFVRFRRGVNMCQMATQFLGVSIDPDRA